MSGGQRPIRTTIMAGGLGGLAFLLTGMPGIPGGLRPMISFAILWCLMAGYAWVLVRWSGRGLTAVVFPLLTLGLVGGGMPPAGRLLALALAMFSWIRSGICYPCTTVQALLRETVLCGGGGLLMYLWGPSSPLSWALGIWLFSLVQSLFFVLFEQPGGPSAPGPPADPFEAARRRIEALLDG